MTDTYIKPFYVSLKTHPTLSEKWVQSLIAADPSIIGLGDLVLRAQERAQPRAGRLDLLLQDVETKRRFEVELQLGATDEAHIIRTIEYWDIERKRYPQYDHCAVLIAEDVTSRFLNVIGLFNGTIPVVAIQMNAIRVGENMTLVFTKVLDDFSRGIVNEDEDAAAAPADRTYWTSRVIPATLEIADKLLKVVQELDQSLELKYNKFYIGISRRGVAFNFVSFRPQKRQFYLDIALPRDERADSLIENSGLDAAPYDTTWNNYRLRLTKEDVSSKREVIRDLMRMAYDRRAG